MKIIILSTLLIFLSFGCTSKSITKIQWDGNLITSTENIDYLYWNDGNQFITQQSDSITVSLAGFDFDNSVYILVSMNNEKSQPVTFYTKNSQIKYQFKNEQISLAPIKPKNLNESHFSFFNTIVGGAGKISRLFLNIPVDILFGPTTEESNTSDKIGGEYHDETINMTKKLFMSNHTLFPDTNYAGFLIFEYNSNKKPGKFSFNMDINGKVLIGANGNFVN